MEDKSQSRRLKLQFFLWKQMTLKMLFPLLGQVRLTHLEHEICPFSLSRNYCLSVFYAIHIRKSSSGEELLALWKSLPVSHRMLG